MSQSDIIGRELGRSEPDYIAFVPKRFDGLNDDSINEHFLVFDGPDGSLMAVWTQASYPAGMGKYQYNRIRFMRSMDDGQTWSEPLFLVGARNNDDAENMASWAFPMVSRSGRIYVLYNRYTGIDGREKMHTGILQGIYSDDLGLTWSEPENISMPKSPHDDPAGRVPGEWIVWQRPERDLNGRYYVGFTHWIYMDPEEIERIGSWTEHQSVCEFMRFENIDEDPRVSQIRISYRGWGCEALRVPHREKPWLTVAQEPSIVRLPDGRLFCTMRTNTGYIWYSISADDGESWMSPRPLLRRDHGLPILQPLACCPIYGLPDGRYILFHHNHPGSEQRNFPRNPCFAAVGEYRADADQPLWFSEPKLLMDHAGFGVNGIRFGERGGLACPDIGVYPSFTTRHGNAVLWHPDRKFFLVGKRITPEFLTDMIVPV